MIVATKEKQDIIKRFVDDIKSGGKAAQALEKIYGLSRKVK